MKRIICICLLAAILIPGRAMAGSIGPARISATYGETLFRTPDSDEWLQAAVNTPLDEGDILWSPEGSRVELQLPEGTIVRLDGGTQLDMIANEDGFIQLHLASGRLYLKTSRTARDNSLQIDADDTTVLPSGRTRLRIDILPDHSEDVAITKGAAYVEGNGSRTRVRAGEHILLDDWHSEILPLNPPDSWETWNTDRDREQSRTAGNDSRLPDELRVYTSELDANGTWLQVPEYGTVWQPAVVVSAGWAPYRSGRWVWKGGEYVWLSHERWGWAPYHYGRWIVVKNRGWCWVPPSRGDVYWGPGYVGWYRSGNQVAWTPLAPGETFFGRRNYGRHSVNITTVNINATTVVYRNRSTPGGVTVMSHNDFLKGRAPIAQPAGIQPAPAAVSVGGPQIRPTRDARMPMLTQAPPRSTPPAAAHRDARELSDRFPRVTPLTPRAAATAATPPGSPQPPPRAAVPVGQYAPPAHRQAPSPAQPGQRPEPLRQDEHRTTTAQPQAPAQPPETVMQRRPPAANPPRQQTDQPRPTTAVPAEGRNRANLPARAEGRPGTQPAQGAVQQAPSAPRDASQKKVWKVATPEHAGEAKESKGENKGRDQRQK